LIYQRFVFGVGFYGCVARIDNPKLTIALGILSLVMVIVFAVLGYKYKKEN
jgi:hypothetical protein